MAEIEKSIVPQRKNELGRTNGISGKLVKRGLDQLDQGTAAESLRILIVDDDHDMRTLLKRFVAHRLQNVEFVRTAEDEEEAVALARELRPDLILMNGAMPRLDGFEATSQIKQELPSTKIIMFSYYFSGDARDRYVGQAYEAGADDWLATPFNSFAEVAEKIEAVLR